MKDDESVPEVFHRLQVIVNDIKALDEEVKDNQFSSKFLRCFPKMFDTLIIVIVKTTMKDNPTPNQVLQEIMADDEFREYHEKKELVNKMKDSEKDDGKKKNVEFKATSYKSKGKKKQDSLTEEESNASSSNEDNVDKLSALFVKVGELLRKEVHQRGKTSSSLSKKSEHSMKYFRCHSKDHLVGKCPYDNGDEDASRRR